MVKVNLPVLGISRNIEPPITTSAGRPRVSLMRACSEMGRRGLDRRIRKERRSSVNDGERMADRPSMTEVDARDDEALVRLARQGNRSACEELFQRHRGFVYRVAFRLLGHEEDAKDAVQDGFIKAFSGLAAFDGRSGFRTWLMRIVTNAALDLGRKRGRRKVFDQSWQAGDRTGSASPDAATHHDPTGGLQRQDLRRVLDLALNRLSPKLRTTFVLFAEAGLSYEEVADVLHVPIGTVMSRINAARQKLQADDGIKNWGELD